MDPELFEMQRESVQNEPQSHTAQNEDISEKMWKNMTNYFEFKN